MDKIILNNMAFFAYHGAMEEEKTLGQRFFIDALLFLDLKQAGKTDDLQYTVHYGMVYEKIKEVVEKQRFDLIEALGHHICKSVLTEFTEIEKMQITIRKPAAPVNGLFDYMAVEISRTREDINENNISEPW